MWNNYLSIFSHWRYLVAIFLIALLTLILFVKSEGINNKINETVLHNNAQLANLNNLINEGVLKGEFKS